VLRSATVSAGPLPPGPGRACLLGRIESWRAYADGTLPGTMTGCFLPTCPSIPPACGQKRLRQCAVPRGRSRSAACRRGCRDRARRVLCPAALGDWGKDAAGGDLDQTRQRLEQAFRQSKSLSRPAPGKFVRLAV